MAKVLNDLSRRNIWLVTGAGGQLASEILRRLSLLDQEVFSRSHAELDISDEKGVEQALHDINPNFVVNAAGFTNVDAAEVMPDRAFRVNSSGPRTLAVGVARLPDTYLVHISTDYVFGGLPSRSSPWAEDDLACPTNVYGHSKAEGERVVREILPDHSVIIRTAWLYAPGFSNFVSTMVDRAVAGTPSKVVVDQWGQPTWARDVADYAVNLAVRLRDGQAPAGTYHATNSGRTTWFSLARRIYERAGADVDLVTPIASTEISRAAKRPPWSVLGHQAWSLAGMPLPRPWEQALDEALPFFLEAKAPAV